MNEIVQMDVSGVFSSDTSGVEMMMLGWKLFRVKPNGKLGPLFINRKLDIVPNVWMQAENHPTPGFAVHPGWHATIAKYAPHLKMELASGEKRVWVRVALVNVRQYAKPESQGGTWLLAEKLMVLEA